MKTKNTIKQSKKLPEMFLSFNTKVWTKLDIVNIIGISDQEFVDTMNKLESYASELDNFNLNLKQKVEELKNSWKPLIGFDLDNTNEGTIEQYSKVCEVAKDIYDLLLTNPFTKH